MLIDTITAFAALLLVLGLLIGMMWAAKRFRLLPGTPAHRGAEREIELMEVLPLSTNTRLAVVNWRGRSHLIAVGPQGATRLASEPYRGAPCGSPLSMVGEKIWIMLFL